MANNQENNEQTTLDKLNNNLGSASEKIAANKKIIYWALAIVALVAAFVLSYFFIYRNPKTNKAFEAYNQVEITAAGNDSIAAAEYKKVADSNSGNAAGNLAAVSAAESYYNLGNYKEAIKYLDKFSSSDPVLEANALVLEGDCYVNLKDYDKAITYYKKAIKKAKGNEQIVPRVLLKEANVYDEQKKYADALSCYEQIKNEYPNYRIGNGAGIDAYIGREKARLGK